MPAGTWKIHDSYLKYLGSTADQGSATFKIRLYTSASNVHTASVNGIASATNEISVGGYAEKTLSGVEWTLTSTTSGATALWKATDVEWTASGSTIAARFAAIYNDSIASPVADPIVASVLLDSTPADVSATSGQVLTILLSSGIFRGTHGY